MKKVFYLLSAALIALTFAACSSSNTPEGAVNAYLKALQANDSRKALEMFYFSKPVSPEAMDEYVQMVDEKVNKQNEKKQGIASWDIGEVQMAEDKASAIVSYTVRYGDGTEQSDSQKTVKIDGKWLLDSGK